jgi:hypothetical protein
VIENAPQESSPARIANIHVENGLASLEREESLDAAARSVNGIQVGVHNARHHLGDALVWGGHDLAAGIPKGLGPDPVEAGAQGHPRH